MKLLRKAGLSCWLAYGLDTSVAADWAGHDEATQLRSYKASSRRRADVADGWTSTPTSPEHFLTLRRAATVKLPSSSAHGYTLRREITNEPHPSSRTECEPGMRSHEGRMLPGSSNRQVEVQEG